MAEFAANNQVSATTQATPFFSNYGFHPKFTVSIKTHKSSPPNLDAKTFALKMQDLHNQLKSNIRSAQDQQEEAVNAKRNPPLVTLSGTWCSYPQKISEQLGTPEN